jgi:hypothetical protein
VQKSVGEVGDLKNAENETCNVAEARLASPFIFVQSFEAVGGSEKSSRKMTIDHYGS